MPLREGFDYPLPKTYHMGVKGGMSCFTGPKGRDDPMELKKTPMKTPGPTRYNPNKIASCLPNIKGGTKWSYCAKRFSGEGSKKDTRWYNPEQPSRAPKWSVPKGAGHKVAVVRSCGADALYYPKKDYVDCAEVGGMGSGLLCQGAVQGLGSRIKKVADFRARAKTEPRVNNYPKRPGPGHYENQQDKVLRRAPVYSQTKVNLEKARFPGMIAVSNAWKIPPGTYEDAKVVKNNKCNFGAQIEQQLGRSSSYSFGAN